MVAVFFNSTGKDLIKFLALLGSILYDSDDLLRKDNEWRLISVGSATEDSFYQLFQNVWLGLLNLGTSCSLLEDFARLPTENKSILNSLDLCTKEILRSTWKKFQSADSIPWAPAPELQPVEPTIAVTESGASLVIQPLLHSVSGSEPLGNKNNTSEPLLSTRDASDMYQSINAEMLETLVSNHATLEAEFQAVIVVEVPGIILRCISPRHEAVLEKVFWGIYEIVSNNARVSAHLAILAVVHDVSKLVVKELPGRVINYNEYQEYFERDIIVGDLILSLAEFNNVDMPTFIDAGRNNKTPTTDCRLSPFQTLVWTSDSSVISVLQYLIYELVKLAVFHEQILNGGDLSSYVGYAGEGYCYQLLENDWVGLELFLLMELQSVRKHTPCMECYDLCNFLIMGTSI